MISILIPTKNEPYIQKLVEEIQRVLKPKHEIIVIDKSDSPPRISGAKLIRQKSNGLGNAVVEGLQYARGEVIVVMDGDGSHRPEDITKLLKKIGSYDIVIGSRFVAKGKTKDPEHRKIVSLIFRKLASLILNLKIEDSMSGFAAFKKEVLKNLRLKPLGYKIIMEILFKARNCKIYEVPIIFERRKAGEGKVGINKAGIAEAFRILRYVLELRLGLR